jgi:hypothetical protein
MCLIALLVFGVVVCVLCCGMDDGDPPWHV